MTQEEADAFQRDSIKQAKELEEDYQRNMDAIDNAVQLAMKEDSSFNVPFIYFQQLAFENMQHQHLAKIYDNAIVNNNEEILNRELEVV